MRDLVAGKLVGDQHPRRVTLMFEECAKEPGRSLSVPPSLDQNVEHVPALIDCPPQVFLYATDLDEHFVEVPLVPGVWLPST